MAEVTGLSKKEIAAVFDALADQIEAQVGKRSGSGQFTIPGLCKIACQHLPAMPERKVRNPETGEMVWAKPKPARKVVKIRALKVLKDMVI